MDDKEWKRSVCLHPSGLMLSLTQHILFRRHSTIATPGSVTFPSAVSKRSELDEWEQWLSEGGVRYSPNLGRQTLARC